MTRRALFIETTHTEVGGVGSRQARLATTLPSRGWSATFALTRGARFHDPDRYRKQLPALDFIELDARTGSSEGRRLAIANAIRRIQPDVVLPGAVLDAWYVAEELKPKGPRIVYGLPGIHLNTVAFLARHSGAIDAAFGVSPLTTRLLQTYCSIPAERTSLVPTGVQPAHAASPVGLRDPIRLLYVGRFDSDKRILDALALADELQSRGRRFHLTLVGSGRLTPQIQTGAARFSDQVSIVAPMPQPLLYEKIYPEADAILLFSLVEGLPNALLEGMAHGLVPITSDFRGRHELGLLKDGETALIFDVADLRGAADRVEDLIRAPAMKERIGTAARAIIEKERSVDAMADAFVVVLERSLENTPRLDYPPPPALQGRSRLRRLAGPRAAEAIRRILGRSFPHPDASEWPLIDNVQPPDVEQEARRLHAAIETITRELSSRHG